MTGDDTTAKAVGVVSVPTYGSAAGQRVVTPQAALAAEIARTNAAVEWLAVQVGELKPDALIRGTKSIRRTEMSDGSVKTVTEAGSVRNELLALFIEERRHLHALCRDALSVKTVEPPSGGWPRAV